MEKQFRISFKYADSYSDWKWRTQRCSVYGRDASEAVEKCKDIYGLGFDCDYEIVSVEEV